MSNIESNMKNALFDSIDDLEQSIRMKSKYKSSYWEKSKMVRDSLDSFSRESSDLLDKVFQNSNLQDSFFTELHEISNKIIDSQNIIESSNELINSIKSCTTIDQVEQIAQNMKFDELFAIQEMNKLSNQNILSNKNVNFQDCGIGFIKETKKTNDKRKKHNNEPASHNSGLIDNSLNDMNHLNRLEYENTIQDENQLPQSNLNSKYVFQKLEEIEEPSSRENAFEFKSEFSTKDSKSKGKQGFMKLDEETPIRSRFRLRRKKSKISAKVHH